MDMKKLTNKSVNKEVADILQTAIYKQERYQTVTWMNHDVFDFIHRKYETNDIHNTLGFVYDLKLIAKYLNKTRVIKAEYYDVGEIQYKDSDYEPEDALKITLL